MISKTNRNLLGELLIQYGKITEKQLKETLDYQYEKASEGNHVLFGQALVETGLVTEEEIAQVLADKAGVPFRNFHELTIDNAAKNLIDPAVAQRYQALPICFEEGKLVVALKHPSNVIAIDDLRFITGYDIKVIIVTDSELTTAIEQFVRSSMGVEDEEEEEEEEKQAAEELTDDAAGDRPAVQLANQILHLAARSEASDVHIEPMEKYMRVRMRIDGVLHEMMQQPRRLHPSLASRIKVMGGMDIADRRLPQDGRITMKAKNKTLDVRVASMPSIYGEKITMRLLDRSARIIELPEMGFSPEQLHRYQQITRLAYGFILSTGPTGSGKSTTLYATLSILNSIDKNIITLEDPVERRMDGINQIQVNQRAGLTFANGLRSIVRNDPDIIMVGEIRDSESARIAVESALTGHLVLATLHTNDACGAITRLADMGIEPYLVASALAGVVGQRLARLLCTNCKEPYTISRKDLLASAPDFPLEEDAPSIQIYRPVGCGRCSHTGYRGRIGVFEVLTTSENIQRLTLENRSSRELQDAAVEEGMITLRQDGFLKVKQGATSLEEIMRVVV